MQRQRRRGRPKGLNIPESLDISVSSSHPRKVAGVFNTMDRILAAIADITRRDKEGNLCLPYAMLQRVSALSELLWEELQLLPGPTTPPLQKSLTIFELILVDIQQILTSDNPGPLQISDGTIHRRLDEFTVQLQETLDGLKGTIGPSQLGSSDSTHFFQNSHHIVISGGTFSSSNPVVHDPVVREQFSKISLMFYAQCGFLFAYAVSPRPECSHSGRCEAAENLEADLIQD